MKRLSWSSDGCLMECTGSGERGFLQNNNAFNRLFQTHNTRGKMHNSITNSHLETIQYISWKWINGDTTHESNRSPNVNIHDGMMKWELQLSLSATEPTEPKLKDYIRPNQCPVSCSHTNTQLSAQLLRTIPFGFAACWPCLGWWWME